MDLLMVRIYLGMLALLKSHRGKNRKKTKPFFRYYFTIFFNFKIYIQVVKLRKQIVVFLYKKKNKSQKHVVFFFVEDKLLLLYFEMHFENSFHLIGANI